jgi:hypothetical protein
MTSRWRLWLGLLAAIILTLGIAGLAMMVPDYSQVRQTVSEIGEIGSPAQVPFALMLSCVAASLLVFASALRACALQRGHSTSAAYFVGFMAISSAGVGIFAFPHPLHNVFGIAELIGYQAPLVMALNWRGDPQARRLVAFSWFMTALVWIAIILNLSTLHRSGVTWAAIRPIYGLVQRSLFAFWFIWCAGAGVLSYRLLGRNP